MSLLKQVEADLIDAIKAKNQLGADVLRGLKTRIQNEQIAKMRELNDEDTAGLVRSEIKKRKEAAESFQKGGRGEMAAKELTEAGLLEKYLPAQMPEEELLKIVEAVISENNFTAKDFGKAMGALKARVGTAADSASLAKLLKERLK